MTVSIRSVLHNTQFKRADPVVEVEGKDLDTPVRWVFTNEREDVSSFLSGGEMLIIEGIHGLNPELHKGFEPGEICKFYLSELTCLNLDDHNRIRTTDARLLRRIVRDYQFRGTTPEKTLAMWDSVRRGEEKWIFPYQENADVMLNSSLFYEISVLRPYAEKILREVPDTVPEYDEARRMLKFLKNFTPIPPDEIPPTSIIREFIGGSSFKY